MGGESLAEWNADAQNLPTLNSVEQPDDGRIQGVEALSCSFSDSSSRGLRAWASVADRRLPSAIKYCANSDWTYRTWAPS